MSQTDSGVANGRTRLDQSLVLQLEHPDDTPSRRHGVTAHLERLHRLYGVSLMRDAWEMLLSDTAVASSLSTSSSMSIPESTSIDTLSTKTAAFATSSTLLHRFYHNVSLRDVNVWSTAMACTLLAAKLLEVPGLADVKKLITVYAHIYRKRITFAMSADKDGFGASLRQPSGEYANELVQSFLQPPGMSPMGPIYQEWKQALVTTEHRVLRALGFLLHWIPNQMPHKYIRLLLGPTDNHDDTKNAINHDLLRDLGQRAWHYCNESLYLDLQVRVSPQVIACSSLLLAQLDAGLDIVNPQTRQPWLANMCRKDNVSLVCNALLGMRQQLETSDSEVHMAAFGFIKSLEPNDGSFNDPLSFLWEMEANRWKELVEKVSDEHSGEQ